MAIDGVCGMCKVYYDATYINFIIVTHLRHWVKLIYIFEVNYSNTIFLRIDYYIESSNVRFELYFD